MFKETELELIESIDMMRILENGEDVCMVKTDIETITKPLSKVLKMRGVTFRRIDSDLDKRQMGVIAQEIEKVLPDFLLRTAHKINSKNRVIIQGAIQKYIDHSISSTINLPEDVNPEIISDIYLKAWKENLKGVTIYRDGSRFPILSTEGELSEFQLQKLVLHLLTSFQII